MAACSSRERRPRFAPRLSCASVISVKRPGMSREGPGRDTGSATGRRHADLSRRLPHHPGGVARGAGRLRRRAARPQRRRQDHDPALDHAHGAATARARDVRWPRHQRAGYVRDRPDRGRLRAGDTRHLSLAIAARPADGDGDGGWSVERIFSDFPNLAARRKNGGAQLSGGEQQMLAIARALVANPRLLLLDEPSEGLAPLIVRQITDIIVRLKQAGMTMLLVEQNFALATDGADDVVILGKGRVRWSGTSAELRQADDVRHTWLGA